MEIIRVGTFHSVIDPYPVFSFSQECRVEVVPCHSSEAKRVSKLKVREKWQEKFGTLARAVI